MSNIKVGFIGLGNVGSKIAQNILLGKYQLFIHDLDPTKAIALTKNGAKFCNTIEKLIKSCTIFITCLPSPSSVSKVMEGQNGALNFINKDHLWIEMSTTDENEMIRLSNLIETNKGEVLEAPITGGQHRAATGNIAVLAAGKRKIFDRAMPILSKIGYEILYCGKIGNASTLKVVTNFLASTNLVSLGEALMVSKKYGIDLEIAYHAIRISSGNSFVHETESKVILGGSYDVGFTMDLVCKDLNLFNKLTKRFKISAKINDLIVKIFEKGKNQLGNRSLSTSIIKLLENQCNEKLRASNFPIKIIDTEPRKNGFEIKF